jgi:hypothetical protein
MNDPKASLAMLLAKQIVDNPAVETKDQALEVANKIKEIINKTVQGAV